jgi:hypothetical protein
LADESGRAITPVQPIDKNAFNESSFEKVEENKDTVLDEFEPESPKNEFNKLNSDGGIDGMYESTQRLQSFKKIIKQKLSTSDPNSIFEISHPKLPEKDNDDDRYELSADNKSQVKTDEANKPN